MAAKFGSLWADLDGFIQRQQYGKVQKACNKILEIDGDNATAKKCLCVALIHLNKFDDVVTLASKSSDLLFERSYALYRLGKLADVRDLLAVPGVISDERLAQLRAQVLYKLGDFDTAATVTKDLLRADPTSVDLATNLSASLISGGRHAEVVTSPDLDLKKYPASYELLYNLACSKLETGDLLTAFHMLQDALGRSEELLKAEGFTEVEMNNELAQPRVQLAYVLQLLRYRDAAAGVYKDVLKSKPTDEGVTAVAQNNLAALNGTRELFESNKRLRASTSDTVRAKLSATQTETMACNRCLLLLYMGKFDECSAALDELSAQFPGSPVPALARAALLVKQKNVTDAVKLLEAFAVSNPAHAPEARLTIAQLFLNEGRLADAASALLTVGHNPTVVAATVDIHNRVGAAGAALSALSAAVEYWTGALAAAGTGPGRQAAVDSLSQVRKLRGDCLLAGGDAAGAIAEYEQLLQSKDLNPATRTQFLATLAIAYAKVDRVKAESVAAQLPSPVVPSTSCEDLELTVLRSSRGKADGEYMAAKAAVAAAASAVDGVPDAAAEPAAKKKKALSEKAKAKRKLKRREKYLAKLKAAGKHVGTPHPDRWKPRYLRRKGRRARPVITGGAQGADLKHTDADKFDARAIAEKAKAEGTTKVAAPSSATLATASATVKKPGGKGGKRR